MESPTSHREPEVKRKKKSDKAKKNFEKNGKYSQKAVRKLENKDHYSSKSLILNPNPSSS